MSLGPLAYRLGSMDLLSALALPHGEEALKARLGQRGHSELPSALRAYLRRLGAPSSLLAHVERLAQGAVVAGQQPGLLGGPSFTFYKAHTALSLAEAVGAAAVFWVASHDHDVGEVRHLHLLRGEEVETLSLSLPQRPMGRIPLGPYREALVAFLGPWAREERVAWALEAGTLGEFFARVLLAFLGERGLIPFDPMAPELAPLFREALERELEDPLASAEAINQGARKVLALGIRPVLKRKPRATNLFLEDEEGTRRLLFYGDGVFEDGVRRYTRKALLEILREDPSRLSPAAGLRPVFQDLVLPTAGFVVGPNELLYVAELEEVYRLHGLEMPALFLRLRGVVLEPPIARILARYRLDPWAFLEEGEVAFLRALRPALEGFSLLEDRLKRLLEEAETWGEEVLRQVPTLVRPALRFRHRLRAEGERLLWRLLRARAHEEGVFRHHLRRLGRHLLPFGLPQERVFPFAMYVLRHPEALDHLEKAPALGRTVLVLGRAVV